MSLAAEASISLSQCRFHPSLPVRYLLLLMTLLSVPVIGQSSSEHVILLHGLCRTKRSMEPMAAALRREGYEVANLDYASRSAPVAALADEIVGGAIDRAQRD